MRRISKQAKELLNQIEEEVRKSLPQNEELKSPISQKERQEWSDAMLELLFLIDNIIFIEQSYTMPHRLDELGELSELSSERVRQVELDAVKKICTNNSKQSLKEFKEAVEEISNAKDGRMSDFAAEAQDPYFNPKYLDQNGKVKPKSA